MCANLSQAGVLCELCDLGVLCVEFFLGIALSYPCLSVSIRGSNPYERGSNSYKKDWSNGSGKRADMR